MGVTGGLRVGRRDEPARGCVGRAGHGTGNYRHSSWQHRASRTWDRLDEPGRSTQQRPVAGDKQAWHHVASGTLRLGIPNTERRAAAGEGAARIRHGREHGSRPKCRRSSLWRAGVRRKDLRELRVAHAGPAPAPMPSSISLTGVRLMDPRLLGRVMASVQERDWAFTRGSALWPLATALVWRLFDCGGLTGPQGRGTL